jgi:hypothetical protein
MKSRASATIIILGIYEIFYSFRAIWNIIHSKLESIFIADIIIKGQNAEIISVSLGVFGLVVGFGLILYKKWAFWGMIVLNTTLSILYTSNLLFINGDDLHRVYQNIAGDVLLRYRITTGWNLFIVLTLLVFTFLCRKKFMQNTDKKLNLAG